MCFPQNGLEFYMPGSTNGNIGTMVIGNATSLTVVEFTTTLGFRKVCSSPPFYQAILNLKPIQKMRAIVLMKPMKVIASK